MGFIADAFGIGAERHQQRIANAVYELKIYGLSDEQIFTELDRRGWIGGLSGKADALEKMLQEIRSGKL
jgi:hypothetical protein